MSVAVVALALIVLGACRPVEALHAPATGRSRAQLYFRSGDSAEVAALQIVKPRLRRPACVIADGVSYPLDTIACYFDRSGRHVLIHLHEPYVQIAGDQVDLYRKFSLRPVDTALASGRSGLNPTDLLQKLPDPRLYRLTGTTLMRMTADNAAAARHAGMFRTYNRHAIVCIAAGATLAAAGAVTALIGGFMSDVDADYRRPYYVFGAAGFTAGAALLTIPLPHYANRALHYRNAALNTYNRRRPL